MRDEHLVRHDPRTDQNIADSFSDDEARAAVLEQMRRSHVWQEHEAEHERRGEHVSLVLHEATLSTESTQIPERTPTFVADESPTTHRTVLTGWCQCQSPSVRLLLGDDGEVDNRPGLSMPTELNSYGVSESESDRGYSGGGAAPVNYLGQSAAPQNVYKP